VIRDLSLKYRINFVLRGSERKSDLTTKCKLFDSIEMARLATFGNAEPSINSTVWGIVID
jgi:hypothetical protein